MSALTTSHWIPDGSGPPLLEGATVGSRLREVAAEVPDRVALVEGCRRRNDGGGRMPKLLADAERCARGLLRYFEPGEHVAVWAHNLPEWVLLEYGAALAGITLVTVNPSFQPAEVAYVLGQSRAAGRVPRARGSRQPAGRRTPRRSAPTCRSCATSCVSTSSTSSMAGDRRSRRRRCPMSSPTTRRRSSTRAARPASRRAPCCATAAWSTTPGCGPTGSASPTARRGCSPMPLFHTGGCVMGVLGALDRRGDARADADVRPRPVPRAHRAGASLVRAGVPTMLIAVDGPPRRVASRSVVVEVDGVRRRPGARGAGAADRGHPRRRLHDRLRPDRVLARR